MNLIHVHINEDKTVEKGLASVTEPRQVRSRAVLKKIVKSTLALLEKQPYEEISIADISRSAGVAIGTVYTRFPSKDQILLHLFDTVVLDDVRSIVGVDPAGCGKDSLDEFLFHFLWSVRNAFTKHSAILRPLTLIARCSKDSNLGQFVRALNTAIHKKLHVAVMRHRRLIRHPRPDAAIQLAILWTGAALREKCLYGEPVSTLADLNDKEFVKELVRGVLAYLTSDMR